MFKNVRHFGIVVADLEESLKFYHKVLGFQVLMDKSGALCKDDTFEYLGLKQHLTFVKLACRDRRTLIELYFFDDKHFSDRYFKFLNKFNLSHISFTVDNAIKLYKKLKKVKGIKVLSPPKLDESETHKLFFIRDHSGNLIELVQELK